MEKQTRRAQRTSTKNAHSSFSVLDIFLKLRYLIGLLVVIVIVTFNLNGSSLGVWDKYVSQREDGKKTDVIFGQSREVRSDEWLVQTPFYLSQAENDYPLVNKDYSLNGQNMIIAYNSPVKDITVIGKPFNWGFFFLGRDRGLSFYWGMKLVVMVLLGFELLMILTKRKKELSLIGAFGLAFSPAVQWWFMQHVGDLIFFTLGLMVAFYHYFYQHEKKGIRAMMMCLIVLFGLGFILVIYPAHQVMLAYLLVFYFVGLFIYYGKRITWDRVDAYLILGAVLLIGGVMLHFWLTSKDALLASLNTLYPGKRVSTGGKWKLEEFFYFLTNWKISFKDINFSNNSEVALFYHFFPTVFLASPFVLFGKKNSEQKLFGRILMVFCLFSIVWITTGLPEWFAELTLLSYVPPFRAILTFSFAACLLTIWFISYIWQEDVFPTWYKFVLLGANASLYAYVLMTSKLTNYFSELEILLIVLAGTVMLAFILFRRCRLFYFAFATLIVVSGCFVNPIVEGTGAIFEKTLAKEIKKIDQKDPQQIWLTEDEIYNFTPTLGVRAFNAVRFYPDMPAWEKIDPKKKYEKYYNRYAHTRAFIAKEETSFILDRSDMFSVTLNFKDAKKLGIKYVVSKRPLTDYNQLYQAQFSQLYGPDKDGYMIFEVSYPENMNEMNLTAG
ncbi:DUF7657 domain-containing protein [Enterococcus ratti]|uniref:YkoY family integral membrane protein n=1 Tax=Enterococcus ratti TaxID=150033 RepID=A0A1L8WDU5_9ENTE|nr:hypothetical protein [Enterococcus ratti]OJG79204.1 hypothetical protein RV14_GL001029 [Enterococcus ratti]